VIQVAQNQRQHVYGKYRGIVTDNQDPDQQGRIKAKVPALFSDEETGWAMASVPYANAGHGFFFLPEVNDTVWIEFEAGDPSRPIWTGCWWTNNNAPQSDPKVKVIETAGGLHLLMDDTGQKIEIKDSNGNTITLSSSGIELARGGMKIEITDNNVSVNDGALTVM
jgi:uncharacterized protein involved in type VI secretion and phage assembly